MASSSPLNPLHQQAEASFLMYGPPAGGAGHAAGIAAGPGPIAVVETFGELEAEYAAIRKGVVVIDLPQRAMVRVTGRERLDFLGRMLTQELKGFPVFSSRNSFWLSRKGRIDADLRLTHLEDQTWMAMDVLAAAGAVSTLTEFIFSEDVKIDSAGQEKHCLALHGPQAAALLALVSTHVQGPEVASLARGQAAIVSISGKQALVERDDQTGDPGFHLVLDTPDVPRIYEQLLDRGLDTTSLRFRAAGWHAFNIARIEAGTPVYNIDFGPQSLPHECGPETLNNRVSFTKGCYLGQEIVARMQSLGHPKQMLAGIVLDSPGDGVGGEPASIEDHPARLPTAGAPVLPAGESDLSKAIGAVTSSTRSPMRSDQGVCFAQMKWESAKAGVRVTIPTDAGPVVGTVRDSLVFWKRG